MSEENTPLTEALSEAIGYLDKKYVAANYDENYEPFNRFLAMLKPGQVMVLAGTESNEKNALALNMLMRKGSPAAYFEAGAERKMIMLKLISILGRIQYFRLLSGELLAENYERLNRAINRLTRLPVFVDTSTELSAALISTKMDEYEQQATIMLPDEYNGFKLMVVNGLERLLKNPEVKDESAQIIAMMSQLKQLAEKHNMPIVVLSEWFPQIAVTTNEKIHAIDIKHWEKAVPYIDTLAVVYRAGDVYPEYPSSKPIGVLLHNMHTASQTPLVLRYWEERLGFDD